MIDIRKLRIQNPRVGSMLQRDLYNKRIIFSLFVKNESEDILSVVTVVRCLRRLKDVMVNLRIVTVSIAKIGDGIEKLHWLPIKYSLRSDWKKGNLQLTICTGKITVPSHDSLIGEHKGMAKTYRGIREKYIWDGIIEDIPEYVRICRECQRKKLVYMKTKLPMIVTTTSK